MTDISKLGAVLLKHIVPAYQAVCPGKGPVSLRVYRIVNRWMFRRRVIRQRDFSRQPVSIIRQLYQGFDIIWTRLRWGEWMLYPAALHEMQLHGVDGHMGPVQRRIEFNSRPVSLYQAQDRSRYRPDVRLCRFNQATNVIVP